MGALPLPLPRTFLAFGAVVEGASSSSLVETTLASRVACLLFLDCSFVGLSKRCFFATTRAAEGLRGEAPEERLRLSAGSRREREDVGKGEGEGKWLAVVDSSLSEAWNDASSRGVAGDSGCEEEAEEGMMR